MFIVFAETLHYLQMWTTKEMHVSQLYSILPEKKLFWVMSTCKSLEMRWPHGKVTALIPGASGPGSSPGLGHCVVFLGKTLNSHSASLHPGI